MTKDKLQAELLEKIKGGIKPSDLKKSNNPSIKPVKKPLPDPYNEPDDGYESDSSIPKAPPLPETKQIKQLKKDVKYWSQTANTHLKNLQLAQAKISLLEEQNQSLKKPSKDQKELLKEKNKQIEIIAKENEQNLQKANKATELLNKQSESIRKAKEVIKELQSKITEQEQTIETMKNKAKTTAHANDTNNKLEINEPKDMNMRQTKTFLCSECNQAKPHSELSRAFNSFSFCLDCSKKARHQAQEQKTKPQLDFTCHLC